MDINPVTPTVEVVLPALVDEKRRITPAGIKKVTRDIQSKCEMLCRTLHIKDICTINYTRSKNSVFKISCSLYENVGKTLIDNYTSQITDNDNSFKDLRNIVKDLEVKYVEAINVYGLEYIAETYRNPFHEIHDLFLEKSVADKIASKNRSNLTDFINRIIGEIQVMMNGIPGYIISQADRLSRENYHERRSTRTYRLELVAEKELSNIYVRCEQFKTEVTDEYKKYQTERICPVNQGHEGIGPAAIL